MTGRGARSVVHRAGWPELPCISGRPSESSLCHGGPGAYCETLYVRESILVREREGRLSGERPSEPKCPRGVNESLAPGARNVKGA